MHKHILISSVAGSSTIIHRCPPVTVTVTVHWTSFVADTDAAANCRGLPPNSSPLLTNSSATETLTLIEALPASELGSLQSPPSRLFATSQESALIQGGHSTMAFAVPLVAENLEGWGPDAGCVPSQLENVPYAPFNKADRLGRASDWTGQAFKYNAGK